LSKRSAKNSDWINREKLWPSKKQQETNYVDFVGSDRNRWDMDI